MDRVDYQSLIVQDLLNDHQDGKLNLNPWYQRRSVWTEPQKSYLINTIFERKPIPALYIRHTIDLERQRSVKEVVDGQQRSRAVLDYCAGKFPARIAAGDKVLFSALTRDQRERFLLTPLPVGYLLGATDEDVIDIFARINSVSKTLNDQEKRNARFSGEFKQFCLKWAVENTTFWRSNGIFTATDISRMFEVLFVSDVIYNLLYGLSDFRPAALTSTYTEFESEFPRAGEIDERLSRVFGCLFELPPDSLKTTIFSRQPILFSLIIALDSFQNIPADLAERLYTIDAQFNDESQSVDILAFRAATAASTQRLRARQTRHEFMLKYLAE